MFIQFIFVDTPIFFPWIFGSKSNAFCATERIEDWMNEDQIERPSPTFRQTVKRAWYIKNLSMHLSDSRPVNQCTIFFTNQSSDPNTDFWPRGRFVSGVLFSQQWKKIKCILYPFRVFSRPCRVSMTKAKFPFLRKILSHGNLLKRAFRTWCAWTFWLYQSREPTAWVTGNFVFSLSIHLSFCHSFSLSFSLSSPGFRLRCTTEGTFTIKCISNDTIVDGNF